MPALRIGDSLDRRLDLEPGDRVVFALMAGQVGLLLGAYTIAKVLRDSMFVSAYGASALPWGYLAVAAASIALLAAESRAVRFLSNARGLQTLSQWLAIGICAATALLERQRPPWLPAAFYVWTGSQAMLLLSQFWITALDAWDSQRA